MKQPIVICTLTALFLSPLAGADTGDRGKARMERLDDNDDGQVTLDEFRMSARLGRMRGGMPGDGDGNVSIDELNAYLDAREAKQAERRARLTERFAAADGDGDGVVTRGEARAALFTRLDANGDGALTRDEMRQRRKGMRGHGKGKGPGGLGRRPWRQDW